MSPTGTVDLHAHEPASDAHVHDIEGHEVRERVPKSSPWGAGKKAATGRSAFPAGIADHRENEAGFPANTVAAVSFTLRPGGLVKIYRTPGTLLLMIGCVLACLGVFIQHSFLLGFGPLFNLELQNSIASWFNSVSLFSCACLLGILAAFAKTAADPQFKNWRLLAIIFLVISMSQVSAVPEIILKQIHGFFGAGRFFAFAWMAIAVSVLAVLGLRLRQFLPSLPSPTRTRFLVAGALYLWSAMVMHTANQNYGQTHGYEGAYIFLSLFEGIQTMVSILLFISALLNHLTEFAPRFAIRLERR